MKFAYIKRWGSETSIDHMVHWWLVGWLVGWFDSYLANKPLNNWFQYDGLVVKHSFSGFFRCVSKLPGTQIQWLTTSMHHLGVPNFETSPSGVPTKRTVCKSACSKLDSKWQQHLRSHVLWIGSLNLQCLEDMTFPAPRWSENQWRSEFSISAMPEFASK